jgi:hypothetical protein
MNIFVLNEDPGLAALDHCDQHVCKMPTEVAQMLNTNNLLLGGKSYVRPNGKPYQLTHGNHPCTKWARETFGNFIWLIEYGLTLCSEYTNRYKRTHGAENAILYAGLNSVVPEHNNNQTHFALCMPNEYKTDCPVESYRNFYRYEKVKFARYYHSKPPAWFDNVQYVR